MYIGYAMDIHDRLNEHKWDLLNKKHGNIHLQNAVNKIGIGNFLFEVLWECEEEQLQSMENWWCNMLNTHNRKYGYNIRNTGPHGNTTMSKESRERMRQSQLKRPPISEETREKRRQIGKNLSKERIAKLIAGSINCERKTRTVVCLDMEGNYIREFKSVKETCIIMNIVNNTMNSMLMGIQTSCKGHIYIHKDKYDPTINYTKRVRKRIVQKFTVEGEFVEEYISGAEAAKANKVTSAKMRHYCRGSNKPPINGYIFKFKTENYEVKPSYRRKGISET